MTSSRMAHEVPVSTLEGVDDDLAQQLSGLGIDSLQDLLFHLPRRWQDRTRLTPIADLQAGEDALIEGSVVSASVFHGRKRILVCTLEDGTGQLALVFFHISQTLQDSLQTGVRLRCFGSPRAGRRGLELCHPEWEILDPECPAPLASGLTPVYPLTDGLTQTSMREICQQALAFLEAPDVLPEWLPAPLRQAHDLWPLADAIRFLHTPAPDVVTSDLTEGQHPARIRLAFEELLAHQLGLQRLRHSIRSQPGIPLQGEPDLATQLKQHLPFSLTAAQQRVTEEIDQDLRSATPMLRLVQGDVGAGKTVVAALAIARTLDSGFQAALMAPTEILATQHYQTFCDWLKPLDIEPVLLTGKTRGKARQAVVEQIASGQARLVLGTHSLFQQDIAFQKLGLVVIDEQHKFGVHQRLALASKGNTGGMPHQLIMTATPIPRTLAMSAYADLDISVIDALPPGRSPITTRVISDSRRQQVMDRVYSVCQQGRQAYWVCTLVEKSETRQGRAAEAVARALQADFAGLTVGLVHGRMAPDKKNQVMADFHAGRIQVLVATTVIEVGVNVPNASVMVIENPERLGLAQLHQLRGRIGRGTRDSYCLLLYSAPLSSQGLARLQVMRESCDGFVIADRDLELRGPGELLGTRQTGAVQFRIADLSRDAGLLDAVRKAAVQLQQQTPRQAQLLIQRWLPQGDQCARA